jgi:hypothetical protein
MHTRHYGGLLQQYLKCSNYCQPLVGCVGSSWWAAPS